jgi:predicted dehydrogenase
VQPAVTVLIDTYSHADLATVLVPNGLHSSVSAELLAQGIHVLCEKPMARNVDECLTMIEAARRGNAQLCIGHNRRFQQHMKLAKQLLGKGLIGDVVGVQAEEGAPAIGRVRKRTSIRRFQAAARSWTSASTRLI